MARRDCDNKEEEDDGGPSDEDDRLGQLAALDPHAAARSVGGTASTAMWHAEPLAFGSEQDVVAALSQVAGDGARSETYRRCCKVLVKVRALSSPYLAPICCRPGAVQ